MHSQWSECNCRQNWRYSFVTLCLALVLIINAIIHFKWINKCNVIRTIIGTIQEQTRIIGVVNHIISNQIAVAAAFDFNTITLRRWGRRMMHVVVNDRIVVETTAAIVATQIHCLCRATTNIVMNFAILNNILLFVDCCLDSINKT